VGTKTKIAAALGRFDTIGQDLVNHCINDILVQGARPLFFLDYVASSKLEPRVVAQVVQGVARACGAAGVALLGGETAEMPGVYEPGELDLAGTIVGVVDRGAIIDGGAIAAGDAVIGLRSSGLHTNGYTLARTIFEKHDLRAEAPGLGRPLGEALLEPHLCYLLPVRAMQRAGLDLRGLAHITGGGLLDNPARILTPELQVRLRPGSWEVPALFELIRREGGVGQREMTHVFNMGLGLLAVLPPDDARRALDLLAGEAALVGEVRSRGDGPAVVLE
jgi:phosphoribosylformylglycinamidine cyclo-ligase